MGSRGRNAVLLVAASSAAAAGCALLIGEPEPFTFAGASDAGGPDVATSDAARADDAASDAQPTYNDIADAKAWSAFDLTTIDPRLGGFFGAAFDGRYLYLAPNRLGGGLIARYDTQGALEAKTSWSVFDLSLIGQGDETFAGAIFAGGAVYFVPHERRSDGGVFTGTVLVRLDTSEPQKFETALPWLTFDLTQVANGLGSFFGGAFDGRYVYFAPWSGIRRPARYDTLASFVAASSYATFDFSSVGVANASYLGAVYDGKLVTFLPISGPALQADTSQDFTSPSGWKVRSLPADAGGIADIVGGGTFDGRYVYGAPGFNDEGRLFRIDSTVDLTNAGAVSFTTLDDPSLAFFGAVFDGRYVYLVPGTNGSDADRSTVVRYDTTQDFAASASYGRFVTTTLGANAKGFGGGAFDGRYVYLVPLTGSTIVRFDAKSPPSLPAAYHGSFL